MQDWIIEHGAERKYLGAEIIADVGDPRWLAVVNAPRLLNDFFWELSGNRVEYDKMVYSVPLTEWLITHKHVLLTELIEYVVSLLSSPAA